MKIIGIMWSLRDINKLDFLFASPEVRSGHILIGNRMDEKVKVAVITIMIML